jgi:hypothetical protein
VPSRLATSLATRLSVETAETPQVSLVAVNGSGALSVKPRRLS